MQLHTTYYRQCLCVTCNLILTFEYCLPVYCSDTVLTCSWWWVEIFTLLLLCCNLPTVDFCCYWFLCDLGGYGMRSQVYSGPQVSEWVSEISVRDLLQTSYSGFIMSSGSCYVGGDIVPKTKEFVDSSTLTTSSIHRFYHDGHLSSRVLVELKNRNHINRFVCSSWHTKCIFYFNVES